MATPNLNLYTPIGTDNVDFLTTYPSDMTKIDTAYGNVSQSAQSANTLATQAKTQAQSAIDASSANATAIVQSNNNISALQTKTNVTSGNVNVDSNFVESGSTSHCYQTGMFQYLILELIIKAGIKTSGSINDYIIAVTDIKPTHEIIDTLIQIVSINGTATLLAFKLVWSTNGNVTISLNNVGTSGVGNISVFFNMLSM